MRRSASFERFTAEAGFRLRSEQEPLSLAGVSDVMEGDVRAGEAISSFFFCLFF